MRGAIPQFPIRLRGAVIN